MNGQKGFSRLVLIASLAVLASCAANDTGDSGGVNYDPLEPFNRKVHAFNTGVDRAFLAPVARGYRKAVPAPVRGSVTNFFSNLTTPRSMLNNFLQGKPKQGFSELGRFLLNSTMGFGGLFDVAGDIGMQRHDESFSETLSVWGVPDGPYLVLPFWGPNVMTDTFALPVDYYSDLWTHYDNTSVRDKAWALRVVDLRYRLLPADALLEDSNDPYVTLREAYRQNRTFRVHDGEPPTADEEEFYDDEMFDEFFEEEAAE